MRYVSTKQTLRGFQQNLVIHRLLAEAPTMTYIVRLLRLHAEDTTQHVVIDPGNSLEIIAKYSISVYTAYSRDFLRKIANHCVRADAVLDSTSMH